MQGSASGGRREEGMASGASCGRQVGLIPRQGITPAGRGGDIRWVWTLSAKQGGGKARGRARLPTNEDGRAWALPDHDCWGSERPHPPDVTPEGTALGAGVMPLQGLILT